MERVREAINLLLRHRFGSHQSISDSAWKPIKAAIDEARPVDNEICAALEQLAMARGVSAAAITLYSNRMGVVEVSTDRYPFKAGGLFATIREVTPPPEPTPEEALETLERCCDGCHSVHSYDEAVRKALTRLRKHVTKE